MANWVRSWCNAARGLIGRSWDWLFPLILVAARHRRQRQVDRPPACLFLSPNQIVPAAPSPRRLPSPSATSGDTRWSRPDRVSYATRRRIVGSRRAGCAPAFTRAFTSLSPERGSDAARVTCSFTFPSPHARWIADGSRQRASRRPPAPGCSPPETLAVHLVVPRPSSDRHDEPRASGGRRWGA
jgi:hypothetical protein